MPVPRDWHFPFPAGGTCCIIAASPGAWHLASDTAILSMVRTRFAPSPTGYLHIGGVRTALFNWLFARRHGGQFMLRIDDTDAERNVECGAGPHSARLSLAGHRLGRRARSRRTVCAVLPIAAAGRLSGGGRPTAGRAGLPIATMPRPRRFRPSAKRPRPRSGRSSTAAAGWPRRPSGKPPSRPRAGPPVVRLKMPREGKLVIDDLVRGQVEFDWAREQDHVIQRADGTCLYHLASVVDDHDFEITHVIRAEEHLSNTPRQIFIAQSLGYPLPQYAHLPYVAEPGSKNKLSKRKLDKYLKNRDFALVNEHGVGDRPAAGPADRGRHVQPGDRRFLRTGGLSARRDHQLPGAAGLVAGRQDRVHVAADDDRQFFARAGDQGAGQLRSQEAVGVPGPLHAGAAAQAEGGPDARLPAAGRAGAQAGALRSRAEADADRRSGRRPAESVRRHPGLRRLFLSGRDRVRRPRRSTRTCARKARASCWRGFAIGSPRVEPFDVRRSSKRRCKRSSPTRASRRATSFTPCAWPPPARRWVPGCTTAWRSSARTSAWRASTGRSRSPANLSCFAKTRRPKR